MRLSYFILVIALSMTIDAAAQISVTVTGGGLYSIDRDGDYELSTQWPSTTGGSSSLQFLHAGTGSVAQFNVMWEASSIFSMGLTYQLLSISTPVSKRHASSANLGVLFKLNFVKNSRKVVPFVQVGYSFNNASTLSQEAVTSTVYSNQKQPAVGDKSTSSSIGFIFDLGSEFKLTNTVSAVVMGGFHGYQLADDNFAKNNLAISYGTGVQSPQGIDGTFFIQFSGGLKYYFGRQKKKRDF